jgi:hypothetical protein
VLDEGFRMAPRRGSILKRCATFSEAPPADPQKSADEAWTFT